MVQILSAAGVPTNALEEIPIITHSCNVCRNWQRPGRRGQASGNTPTNFNEEIQVDLMSYHSVLDDGGANNVLHMIDVST
eukprot:4769758-Amphidinium_carterae.1